MEENNVFDYISLSEISWKTDRIPLTNTKDWNMSEHIERCTNVSNGWFHSGKNDGIRPYNDIVSPIIDVAFRSEGFDVKDIVPFVDDIKQNYKSLIVKKRHPQWARENELDTFIDEVVETSIIYDLVLVKNLNGVRPEVIDLKNIAFCDQTNIMSGPICIKHQYTPSELTAYYGKWNDDAIDNAIALSREEIEVSTADNQKAKTPGKYIKVYELRGNLPERWLKENGGKNKYTNQMWIVCYYKDKDGNKQGITLYSGEDKPLSDNFKALKIDQVRSKGRACGKSPVERLFEPQVWNNYAGIKLKNMLDGAVDVFISDSDELGNQKLTNLKTNTILKQAKGDTTTRLNSNLANITNVANYQVMTENSARTLGSASEASLGKNPVSGTPFALQQLIVQQGEGIHEYRQGKIATFFADVLYRDWILKYLVADLNTGKKFSEELSLDELQDIAETIASNEIEERIKKQVLETGKVPTNEERDLIKEAYKQDIVKGKTKMYSNGRGFFESIKDELKEVPISTFVNIKGKQRYMAQNADKLSNLISNILKAPGAIAQIPGVGKLYNELLEESGFSPIDFSQITKTPIAQPEQQPNQQTNQQTNQQQLNNNTAPVGEAALA